MFDMTTLGRSLRELRERKGLGLRQLAQRLGKGHGLLSDYENGKKTDPNLRVLAEIAQELGAQYLDLERFLLAQIPEGNTTEFKPERQVQLELPFEEESAAQITCQRIDPQKILLTVAIGKAAKRAS